MKNFRAMELTEWLIHPIDPACSVIKPSEGEPHQYATIVVYNVTFRLSPAINVHLFIY